MIRRKNIYKEGVQKDIILVDKFIFKTQNYVTPHLTSPHRFLFWLILILAFPACTKEKLDSNPFKQGLTIDDQQVLDRDLTNISISDARQWFSGAYGQKKSITNQATMPNRVLDVAPVWAFAQTATYLSAPIVICPILPPAQAHSLSRFVLVLYRTTSNQIASRLVIFRGANEFLTNGSALTLSNFSGAIGSLDLSGNYSGTMHLLRNGVQTGEVYPSINGDGLIFGNGNGGNIATQIPFWEVTGSGNWYSDGNTVWYNGGPGPFINQTFTPIVPVSTPAGGGSVTGPPNSSPLATHFQNLLANPLYILEEFLYNHNIDAGVFDFLSNAAKTVLANRLYFIDLLNDFLQNHNNSSAAQALVTEILTEVSLYNLTSLTTDDLNSLYDSLQRIDEVVVGPTGEGGPGISAANPMCPQMFDFQYTSPSQLLRSAGILHLKAVLPLDGVNTDFTFGNVFFLASKGVIIGCDPLNTRAANAINAAVASTIQRSNNNALYGGAPLSLSDRTKRTFLSELYRNFSLEVNSTACGGGEGIHLMADVKLLGVGQVEEYNVLYNTIFKDFSTDFSLLCN